MDETMTEIRFMVFPTLNVKGEISSSDIHVKVELSKSCKPTTTNNGNKGQINRRRERLSKDESRNQHTEGWLSTLDYVRKRVFQNSRSVFGASAILKAQEINMIKEPAARERVEVNQGKGKAFNTFLL
ncbi:hypothetical protein Leryth_025733 [Lithospermum erythrorhizon]|nr:hypothetical protein Leryth_025733 [Lithospermum erythrorhizon]